MLSIILETEIDSFASWIKDVMNIFLTSSLFIYSSSSSSNKSTNNLILCSKIPFYKSWTILKNSGNFAMWFLLKHKNAILFKKNLSSTLKSGLSIISSKLSDFYLVSVYPALISLSTFNKSICFISSPIPLDVAYSFFNLLK